MSECPQNPLRAALPSLVKPSAAEMGSDLGSLIGREFPSSVRDALPSLASTTLTNSGAATAEWLGR